MNGMDGMGAGPPSGRATCQNHGLRYDPSSQAGCVLCRRQSVGPAGDAVHAQPAGAKVSVPRWVYALAVVALVFLAGLVSLIASMGRLMAEANTVSQQQAGSQQSGTAHSSSEQAVTIWVPATWNAEKLESDLAANLAVVSRSGDVGVVVVNEPASDFEPAHTLDGYLAGVRAAYSPGAGLVRVLGAAEACAVGGFPALRAPFEGSNRGVRVRGHIYVVRGPSHFHQFLVFGAPSAFARKATELQRIVTGATLR